MQEEGANTFYYALKSQMNFSGEQNVRTDQVVWKNVRNILETKLLGWSRDADFELQQQLRQQRHDPSAEKPRPTERRANRPHLSMLKAKVVGTVRGDAMKTTSKEEIQNRCTTLPFLENNSLLISGDVLVLWRVPIDFDAVRRIYNKKRQPVRAEDMTPEHRALLRLPDRTARYADVPVLLGRHQWTAERSSADAGAADKLEFDDEMSEEQRMAAVIAHAGSNFEFSAEDQRKHLEEMRHGRASHFKRPRSRLPPESYVCVRCNIPGHWVQFCPTRNDTRYDPKNILSTNGVSKRYLKRIEIDKLDPEYSGNIYRDQLGQHYIRDESVKDKAAEISAALFDLATRVRTK